MDTVKMTEKILISEIVKGAVNQHGELHLDKEKTEALIRYIKAVERYEEQSDKLINNLRELL